MKTLTAVILALFRSIDAVFGEERVPEGEVSEQAWEQANQL